MTRRQLTPPPSSRGSHGGSYPSDFGSFHAPTSHRSSGAAPSSSTGTYGGEGSMPPPSFRPRVHPPTPFIPRRPHTPSFLQPPSNSRSSSADSSYLSYPQNGYGSPLPGAHVSPFTSPYSRTPSPMSPLPSPYDSRPPSASSDRSYAPSTASGGAGYGSDPRPESNASMRSYAPSAVSSTGAEYSGGSDRSSIRSDNISRTSGRVHGDPRPSSPGETFHQRVHRMAGPPSRRWWRKC